MDYEQVLEKAILEHAAEVKRNPRLKNGHTRIPGFMEGHVQAKALQLSEIGLLAVAPIGDNGTVIVAEISDQGAERLAAIREEETRIAEEKKARAAAAQPARKKSWWRR